MKIAIIKNGKVANIITGDESFAKSLKEKTVMLAADAQVGIGYTYNTDGSFTAPAPSLPAIEELEKQKKGELDALEAQMRALLRENALFALVEGNAEAAKQVLVAAKAAKAIALKEINALVDAKDAAGLHAYQVTGPKTNELFEAIKNLAS